MPRPYHQSARGIAGSWSRSVFLSRSSRWSRATHARASDSLAIRRGANHRAAQAAMISIALDEDVVNDFYHCVHMAHHPRAYHVLAADKWPRSLIFSPIAGRRPASAGHGEAGAVAGSPRHTNRTARLACRTRQGRF